MRTKEIYIYTINELSEAARKRAIERWRDEGLNYWWWKFTYEDAEQVGIKITGFDDDTIDGKLIGTALESIEAILKDHGEECATYLTAKKYRPLFTADAVTRACLDPEAEEDSGLAGRYLKEILRDYKKMLEDEAEYLQSDECILETIESNEYEFYEDGTML